MPETIHTLRFAVISDIHSNLEALAAVFQEIDRRGVEVVYSLGDVVGYGADPAACIDRVRERCTAVVLGNHDQAVLDRKAEGALPRSGRAAARHNRKQLSEEQLDFLEGLPLRVEAEGCTFVHATPENPGAWQRIGAFAVSRRQFDYFDTDVCFIGHTHVPGLMAHRIGALTLRRGNRYLINAGSVGQPRDGDPRACLVLFDTEAFAWELVRVEYDVERAAKKIINAGLPENLATRLVKGY